MRSRRPFFCLVFWIPLHNGTISCPLVPLESEMGLAVALALSFAIFKNEATIGSSPEGG